MQSQLYSFYQTKRGPELVTLFGYATKSLPGIEINGLGRYGKAIKEKIIYITRSRGLQIPLKRFVLCVEMEDSWGDMDSTVVKNLEFPLLVMYWHLAGLLPLSRIDNCVALGSLTPEGKLSEAISDMNLRQCIDYDLCLISSTNFNFLDLQTIDAKEVVAPLFGEVG
ncbi:MAG: hypothetical protein ACOVP4_12275 [Bacteriovoracaceae bacterium]|jgi:hypothetical protein